MAKSKVKTSKSKKTSSRATSKTSAKTSGRSAPKGATDALFGFSLKGWVQSAKPWSGAETRSGSRAWGVIVTETSAKKAFAKIKSQWGSQIAKWQETDLKNWLEKTDAGDVFLVVMRDGPVWFMRFVEASKPARDPLVKSLFARSRDAAGTVYSAMKTHKPEKFIVQLDDASRDEMFGILVGLEMAQYSFAESRGYKAAAKRPALIVQVESDQTDLKKMTAEASRLGTAVNLARHLTNLPGGTLNPETYAQFARALMSGVDKVKTDIWSEDRLKAENMNLLLAVGGAAEAKPRLVHVSYRPTERGAESKPVALVGKGITFDSGGLDIKPSAGMRLMKKDMGGSAAALALTWWAAESGLPLAMDTYLALAENAVSSGSFRPGDIIEARNGLAIEIHNTDAEGRLVLADALDVAVSAEGDEHPACVINLATLTGAIKVGLGSEIAGLFTTSDDLAREIYDAGLKRGDLSWRMPLYQPYKNSLRSPFADHINAPDGFGGAITAALFLELFTREVPWAHLDIYAWRDSAGGAWGEPGGSGQGVLSLSEVLSRFVSGKWAEG